MSSQGLDVGLRDMMSRFPSGVAVVTAFDPDGTPRGMTCSSLCSATLEPPTLLVCLRTDSPTAAAVTGSGMFAVNLLDSRGRSTAELFSSGSPQRFSRVPWHSPEPGAGPHLLDHAHTVADCAVVQTIPTGGHLIVLGHPLTIARYSTAPPLLYGLRDYHSLPQSTSGTKGSSAR